MNALITLDGRIIGKRMQAPVSGETAFKSELQSHPVDAIRRTASKSYLKFATIDP
jgi:hypothetical protein